MPHVRLVEPTTELIEIIAEDMRPADVAEIWASKRLTPLGALVEGWADSSYAAIVIINDEPCAMLGLAQRDILGGVGVPWLLGTNAAMKYKREFLLKSPPIIDHMLEICPKLFNFVHVDNKISIRWLKWLGFTIDEPKIHGIDGDLFHMFHLERLH